MEMKSFDIFSAKVSRYMTRKEPFIFVVNYEMSDFFVCPISAAQKEGVLFSFPTMSNFSATKHNKPIHFSKKPVEKEVFNHAFQQVMQHIKNGDSYLLNLTFPSDISCNLSLKEILDTVSAPYKLLYKNQFIVFSPECFVKTKDNFIYSYPMKGTIDASIDNAEELLLQNKKELCEHHTIVDLIRNDLSIHATDVTVSRFRYIEKIETMRGALLQSSSEIRGFLDENWEDKFVQILSSLLPAGSITGAPKEKTVEIIAANEIDSRGFYTGVFGIFDGKEIDSAVAIRFIEQKDGKKRYRSGGGITAYSEQEEEYKELIQKIYVPTI